MSDIQDSTEVPALFPLHHDAERMTQHCRVALHLGTAKIKKLGDTDGNGPFAQLARHLKQSSPPTPPLSDLEFDASFLMPATGNCLIFLRGDSAAQLNRNFGEGLRMTGSGPDGAFLLHAPQFYVKAHGSDAKNTFWAIAQPVNCTSIVSYGDSRPVARVSAIINNFDFERGNVASCTGSSGKNAILRVQARGRSIDFIHRRDHESLELLLRAGALRSGSLTEFSFSVWEGASDEELSAFADSVAGLCSIAACQHTSVPVLSLLDADGRPIKRLLRNALESRFRDEYIIPSLHFDRGLPKLFLQCFEKYTEFAKSSLWRRIPAFCASIQDPPYLEQKCATLMAGLELLIRNSLIEDGKCPEKEVATKQFGELISAARGVLRWDIPKHYTKGERTRLLRNAVAHGGPLPQSSSQIVEDLQKWSLFLMRRLLIQLGFDGEVACAEKGFAAISDVSDFSESKNNFTP